MKEKIDTQTIDIREDYLLKKGQLLDLLLQDKSTGKNILWATDSYESKGKRFAPSAPISSDLITGKNGKLIQPRAVKSKKEQLIRTRDKAEVFTPLGIVKQMNEACDTKRLTKNNWQEYVALLKLEITCGEAPYIISRYDPISDKQELLPISKRVGFLDKKLSLISKYCDNREEWLNWVLIAFKSSYGYEWQGDSLLIARENLLYTFIDYYKAKFKETPGVELLKELAEIIVWNIFQMDGLRYVIPMSCMSEEIIIKGEETLFEKKEDYIAIKHCSGCEKKIIQNHNGVYVKIMDWVNNQAIKFIEIVPNN
ncbi:restriction endonuclease subunit M [Aquirufa antheringensis]|uniref:restriction endonuclease subunit M n=1 Tax=Aquirufa antheringensis TaxID=2516559 RepID=UPI001032B687|nr:restriction endonuclease subunit M [Aquirufa antheringensis]TBH72758.1 restriction endonuclease subunit M [Aquirufa antheringensis]